MGNDLSSIPWKGESGVDIMGQDDTIQEITTEEQQILNHTSKAFHKFYIDPFTNYEILSPHKSIYLKAHGKNFELYQWIIEKTHFGGSSENLDFSYSALQNSDRLSGLPENRSVGIKDSDL